MSALDAIQAEHRLALRSLTAEQRRALARLAEARRRAAFNARTLSENLCAIWREEADRRPPHG